MVKPQKLTEEPERGCCLRCCCGVIEPILCRLVVRSCVCASVFLALLPTVAVAFVRAVIKCLAIRFSLLFFLSLLLFNMSLQLLQEPGGDGGEAVHVCVFPVRGICDPSVSVLRFQIQVINSRGTAIERFAKDHCIRLLAKRPWNVACPTCARIVHLLS